MEFYGIPFVYRLLILLVVLFVLGAFDFLRNGKKATRWREYVFLVVCATLGAIIGMSTDAVTPRISPEYFTIGKGVQDGDGFASRVLLLGAHAGFLAGAVAAMCCLVANNPCKGLPAIPYQMLSRLAFIPLASAAIGGLVAGTSLSLGAAGSVAPLIEVPVGRDQANAFVVAWGIHTGLYTGLFVGVVLGVVRVRRARKSLVHRLPADAMDGPLR